MSRETERTYRNHRYEAAGRTWIIPSVTIRLLLGPGNPSISLAELQRIQRGIVHALCMQPADLTFAEFEFLCDATQSTQTEAATVLGLHKSALSKWKARSSGPSGVMSSALKRYFWFKHFGDRIARVKAPLHTMATDSDILHFIRDNTTESDLDAPSVRNS